MQIGEYEVKTSVITKLHNCLLVEGWFFHPTDRLAAVALLDNGRSPHQISSVGTPTAMTQGDDLGFRLQALRAEPTSPLDAVLEFNTAAGERFTCALRDLAVDRRPTEPTAGLAAAFRRLVCDLGPRPLILDVGGRPRSGNEFRHLFPDADYRTM